MKMQLQSNSVRLAQSASALGAGILGFGLGIKWGEIINPYAIMVIVTGAVIHVWGMYIMQLKDSPQANRVAKLLWLSAWTCLNLLVGLIIYFVIKK
jgi:hypothetical protein